MTSIQDDIAADYDIDSIRSEEWPKRRFPVRGREWGSQVVVKRSVVNDVHAHGKSSPEVEICGVLIGNVYQDLLGEPFVYVQGAIRGCHAENQAAQVTFTAETWTYIQDELDNKYKSMRILGWYHTHPGYGIFLSDMDVFIHENFFSLPWHTALVYDPAAHEEGLFVWREGKLKAERFLIEDDVVVDEAPATMNTTGTTSAAGAPPGTVLDLSARLQTLETRQRWLVAALVLMLLVAVAWPIAFSVVLPRIGAGFVNEPAGAPVPVQNLRDDRSPVSSAVVPQRPAAETALGSR